MEYSSATPLDYELITGFLQSMSNEDLKRLLEDDSPAVIEEIDKMIESIPKVKCLETDKERQISSNKTLALNNMARDPDLTQANNSLKAKLEGIQELKQQVEEKKRKLDENSRQTSVDITLALLQTSCAEAEEESENIAKSLLSGAIGLDEFFKGFPSKRKTYHLRRIKTEKLMEFVRTQPNSEPHESINPIRKAPPTPGYHPPYPTGPTALPSADFSSLPFTRPPYN